MNIADERQEMEEDATAEDYLQRMFSELATIQSKVHLKIAKLHRQRAWIFKEGRPPTPILRQNVRQAMAMWITVMQTAPRRTDYVTEEAWKSALDAWGDGVEAKHGRRRMRRLSGLREHFDEEILELLALLKTALESPHVPLLRQALDVPNYETPQVYFEQLAFHFLGVFVADNEDSVDDMT